MHISMFYFVSLIVMKMGLIEIRRLYYRSTRNISQKLHVYINILKTACVRSFCYVLKIQNMYT